MRLLTLFTIILSFQLLLTAPDAHAFGRKKKKSTSAPPAASTYTPITSDRVWYTGNTGSVDLMRMFDDDQLFGWSEVRSKLQVVKFYSGQVTLENCTFCGQNNYENFLAHDVFRKMESLGLKTAFEIGAIKPGSVESCTGESELREARLAFERVRDAGGKVYYVSMDDPIASYVGWDSGPLNCFVQLHNGFYNPTPAEAAQILVDYIRRIRAIHAEIFPGDPQLKVGLSDAYPFSSFDTLKRYLQAMVDLGTPPDFFHLDAGWKGISGGGVSASEFKSGLQDFVNYCRARGIPFGAMFVGETTTSQDAYRQNVIDFANRVHDALPQLDQLMVQSWNENPGANPYVDPRTMPNNLPMSDPTSGLGILREVVRIFGL